jgi:predicted nucleotidyltransferase component of viral defense system
LTEFSAADAYRRLQRRAREEGRGTEELLVLYAHEAFLRRLAMSRYREQMVLKGGMLMAVLDARRPTRDADLSTHGIANDENSVKNVVAHIVSIHAGDGVTFDADAISATVVREDAEYHGIRVVIPAELGTARIKVQLDLSFGDPVVVREILYPTLLDDQDIRLRGYPISLALAEKIATMMSRGAANTRDRDFADVATLSRVHVVQAQELRDALEQTAAHRGHSLKPLRQALGDLRERRQQTWAALRRRAGLDQLPAEFSELVDEVQRFVDPIVETTSDGMAWDPARRRWMA